MEQKEMAPIIEPLDRESLLAELTPARKMRDTNKAGNESTSSRPPNVPR